jgi:hypothetical protein
VSARKGTEVVESAMKRGISERTLRRARELLSIKVKPGGMRGAWLWALPDGEDRVDQNTIELPF